MSGNLRRTSRAARAPGLAGRASGAHAGLSSARSAATADTKRSAVSTARPASSGDTLGHWAGLVVRDSLEDVGAAEEGPQLRVEARVVPRQPPELAPYARVLL